MIHVSRIIFPSAINQSINQSFCSDPYLDPFFIINKITRGQSKCQKIMNSITKILTNKKMCYFFQHLADN